MEATRSALAQIADTIKYDVIYVNTPWGSASVDELKSLDLAKIANSESALFFWASNAHLDACVDLIRQWGFEFHSVHQISEIAQHQFQRPPSKPKAPKDDASPMDVEESKDAESKDAEQTESHDADKDPQDAPKPKKAIQRKFRPAQVHVPNYFGEQHEETVRNTTEQLWVAVKGGESVLGDLRAEKSVQLPYQIAFFPDLGKKSRVVKKADHLDPMWMVDRPVSIRDTLFESFAPEATIIELFGSQSSKRFDALGPNVPGTYAPSHDRDFGISEALGSVLGAQKKNVLVSLVAKIHKMMAAGNTEDRRQIFDAIKDIWAPISEALSGMRSPVSYDMESVEGVPPQWLLVLVEQMTASYISSFVSKKKKTKGKRDASAASNPDRPRHGIAAPQKISADLADFLGVPRDELMARTTAVKLVNNYMKDHKLQNEEKKIEIIPDEALRKLMGLDEGVHIHYFDICKYLGPHFIKKVKVTEGAEGAEAAVEEPVKKVSKKKRPSVEEAAAAETA
ncbi:unnamed protein product, partial [Phaeothamnion confervicola]